MKGILKSWSMGAAILSVSMVGLAGCGQSSGGSGNNGGTNQSGASNSSKPSTSTKKVNLVLTMWGGPTDTKTYQDRANLYTKEHPNVKITVKNIPNGHYDQELETMIAGGSSPDIVEVSQDFAPLAAKGAIMNLSPSIKSSGISMNNLYSTGFINSYQYQGKQYAMPDRGGYILLFYNKTMFDKAGLSYPKAGWTWNEFLQDAQKLTIQKNGKTVQWGCAIDDWWPEYMAFTYGAGGWELNQSMTKATMATPQFQKGLEFYNDLAYKYKVSPTTKDYANLGKGTNRDSLFAQGKNAMSISGFWDIPAFEKQNLKFGMAPLPVGPSGHGGMAVAGTGLAVASKSKYPKIAFDVVKFMTSAKGEMPIVQNKEDLPAVKPDIPLWEKSLPQGVSYAQMAAAQSDLFSPRISPKWNEIQSKITQDFTAFFNGKENVQKATQQADKDVNQILAGQ